MTNTDLTFDDYATIGRIAEEAIESEEKICGYKHIRKSGNGYGNIGKFICDRIFSIMSKYPKNVKGKLNDFRCSLCGADITRPEIPYAHKSAAGNLMPGHKEVVMEDRKCPHYQVRFRSQQNYNSQTGRPDYKPAGWYCAWCEQPFGLLPSLDPLYESIDSEVLESVLKKGKERDKSHQKKRG